MDKLDIVKQREKHEYSRSVFHDLPENFLLEAINAAMECQEEVKLKFRTKDKIKFDDLLEVKPQVNDMHLYEKHYKFDLTNKLIKK